MDYLKINANDQLDIKGSCVIGCNNRMFKYSYRIYMIDESRNQSIKLENASFYFVQNDALSRLNLTIKKELFSDFYLFKYWRVELVTFNSDLNVSESTSLQFYVNQPPKPGMCKINPLSGTTSTLFTIYCFDWIDEESDIVNYTFYGKKLFICS